MYHERKAASCSGYCRGNGRCPGPGCRRGESRWTAIARPDIFYLRRVPICDWECVGSLFPDIDLPSSTIGKSVKPLSLIINRLFGHRGLFHAPLLYLLAASALISGIKGSIWFALVLGFFYGITLHLLQDMMTRDGIPFFYPVTKKISLSRMKTGDFANIPATAVLFVLFCLLWRLP